MVIKGLRARRRIVAVVGLSLCAMMIVLTAWAPLATLGELPVPLTATQPVPTLSKDWEGGSPRRVPLTQPQGAVERNSPNGVTVGQLPNLWDFPATIADLPEFLVEAIDETDQGEWMWNYLLNTYDTRASYSQETGPLPFSLDGNNRVHYAYPYRYPRTDVLVKGKLPERVALQYWAELVDAASAMVYSGYAPQAYSLLRRLSSFRETCDVQLNLAVTVALGNRPNLANVDLEFEKAARLCKSDPLVYVAWAKSIFALSTRDSDEKLPFKLGIVGQENRAVSIARRAQRDFPEHVGGYQVEAMILLEVADKYTTAGVRHFSARRLYQRVIDLLEATSKISADPTVAFGWARAMAGLGHYAEAADRALPVIGVFKDPMEKRSALDSVLRWLLSSSDPERALLLERDIKEVDIQVGAGSIDRLCNSLLPIGTPSDWRPPYDPEPGQLASCDGVLVDATGNSQGGGADAFDFIDYIPTYRHLWSTGGSGVFGFLKAIVNGVSSLDPGDALDASWIEYLNDNWAEEFENSPRPDIEPLQNAYRQVGMFAEAERYLRKAISNAPSSVDHWLFYDRLGEVQFLQGLYSDAAASFDQAAEAGGARSEELDAYYPQRSTAWSRIKQATALYRDGRYSQAIELAARIDMEELRSRREPGDAIHGEVARSTLAGNAHLRSESYAEAAVSFERAIAACAAWAHRDTDPCASGVPNNNASVAYNAIGKAQLAAGHAQKAIAYDPASAMFIEQLANCYDGAGAVDDAIGMYVAATEADPTQFTAWNNLGVILVNEGRSADAHAALQRAVIAKPDYGVGWFNLGVVMGRSNSPSEVIASQGALGRAVRLDSSLRGIDQEPISDLGIYDPGLDLSKPIPPNWRAGASRQSLPVAFTVGLMFTVVLNIVRALIDDEIYGRVVQRVLELLPERPGGAFARAGIWQTAIAVVTAAIVGAGTIGGAGGSPWLILWAAVLSGGLLAAFLSSRRLVSNRSCHGLSLPATGIGLLGMPMGLGFAPVPVLRTPAPSTMERFAPSISMAVFCVLGFALAFLSGVPLVRSTGLAALMFASSSLVPIRPLDGLGLTRMGSLAVAFSGVGITVATTLNWI